VGLPSIPTILFAEHFIFLTLTPRDRLTIAHIVGVTGRIITVIRTIHTMLTASRANVLKPNHSTTAIANHRYLFFLLLISVFYGSILECQLKKIGGKIFCFGMAFALAQDLLILPFWQFSPPICHFGSFSAILAG
jgi:hypothetical protein